MNTARLRAALIAALAIASFGSAFAADPPPEPDKACLACHGAPGLEKTFANGDKVALHVDSEAYG
ncbi:MAG: hypothetical protein ACXWF2_16125, partial [Usitatibacter sp.]